MSEISNLDGIYRDIVGNDAYNNKNVTIKILLEIIQIGLASCNYAL